MTTRRFIIIISSVLFIASIVLIVSGILQNRPHYKGTSVYNSLDIASGEINAVDRKSVIPTIRNITGIPSLQEGDILLDPSTYKKTYQDGSGYTIHTQFLVPKAHSRYDAVFQYLDHTTPLGVYMYCSDAQPTTAECIDKVKDTVDTDA